MFHHFETFSLLPFDEDRKCCTGISDSSEERFAFRGSYHVFPATDCHFGSAPHVVKTFDGLRTNFNATEPRISLTMEAESSINRSSWERTAGSFVDSDICDRQWYGGQRASSWIEFNWWNGVVKTGCERLENGCSAIGTLGAGLVKSILNSMSTKLSEIFATETQQFTKSTRNNNQNNWIYQTLRETADAGNESSDDGLAIRIESHHFHSQVETFLLCGYVQRRRWNNGTQFFQLLDVRNSGITTKIHPLERLNR